MIFAKFNNRANENLFLIRRETHGGGVPEGWEIAIVLGETEEALVKMLKEEGLIDNATKIIKDCELGKDSST